MEGPNSARANLLRNRNGLYVRVDVSSCVEGENTLRFREVWPEGINYDDLTAQRSTITVKVEKLYSKTFGIQFRLEGKIANGYQMEYPRHRAGGGSGERSGGAGEPGGQGGGCPED